MTDKCPICRQLPRLDTSNPYFIAEPDTGYAVLGENQLYKGYTIFIAKRCVAELHDLPRDERASFLSEMAMVAEAVFRAFSPRKLNYELLGNSVTHLHWHLFPRYADDPNPQWPVWNNPAFLDVPIHTDLSEDELRERSGRIARQLDEFRSA